MEIVIGLVIAFVVWSYIKARTRINYVNKQIVEEKLMSGSDAPYPSWIINKDRTEEFKVMLGASGKRKSIPEKFIVGVMANDYSQKRLLFTAGLMEQQGASFEEQTMAVMDCIEKYWSNMDLSDRIRFSAAVGGITDGASAIGAVKPTRPVLKVQLSSNGAENLEWMHNLWYWADKHDIEEYNIPREKKELLNLKHLSFESISYFDRGKFSLLPKEIGKLRGLKFLELGNVAHPEIILNNLTELPKEIGNLTELTHLYLQFNSLSELPSEIGSLTKLKDLKLGGNNLSHLPKEIGRLKELEILTVWGNNLKELPKEIGLLTSLKGLDISRNSLAELPNEITNLTALKSFYYYNCGLQLSELQKSWITMLKNNGCELYPEEIEDDLFDDDLPF